MGRPTEPTRRDHQLNFSLTKAEFELIAMRAAAAELRMVDYGRRLLLREGTLPVRRAAPAAQIDRLAYEQLKRLGNNLNQIARQLNATKGPVPSQLPSLLQDIRAVLNRGASIGS